MLEVLLLVMSAEQCFAIEGMLTYVRFQSNEECCQSECHLAFLNLGKEWATYPDHLRSRSTPLGNLGARVIQLF